jgi:hypothetical protein
MWLCLEVLLGIWGVRLRLISCRQNGKSILLAHFMVGKNDRSILFAQKDFLVV